MTPKERKPRTVRPKTEAEIRWAEAQKKVAKLSGIKTGAVLRLETAVKALEDAEKALEEAICVANKNYAELMNIIGGKKEKEPK